MIQVYSPSNKNFEMNGDMVLFPEVCELEAELSGSWVINVSHPLDDEGRWKHITEEAVLSVPTFMGEKQLYRIDEVDKLETGVSAKAYPIFFDSANETFLMNLHLVGKNGQEALDEMTAGSKFSGKSNISTGGTAYFVRRNLMDAIGGSDEPTFLRTWGGEPLYDNFKVIINERAGGDYGAQVRYGMNMEHVNYKVSMTNTVTRIIPVAYNERLLSTGFVDSPLIGKYAKVYTKEIKFEDVKLLSDLSNSEDTEGIIVCNTQEELDAALIGKCNEQFSAGIDLPAVTIEVDMVALENTEEYKDFVDLVKVSLGDTVGCYNSNLDITTQARAIKIVWDCITNSIISATLGDYKENILNEIGSTVDRIGSVFNSDGTIMAERVQGILNGIKTQIKIQSTAAQPVDGRAFIIEDLDPESPLYGCMVYGTQGIQISKQRTQDGRAWDFTTAMTASGIVADVILTGLLADKTGSNYWNLDTGEFSLSKGNIRISSDNSNYRPIILKYKDERELHIGATSAIWYGKDYTLAINKNGITAGKTIEYKNSFSEDVAINARYGVISGPTYNQTTSNASNVYVNSVGEFYRAASSSERYKTDITEEITKELDPRHLYDVPIKVFKYKDGYLSKSDDKNEKEVIGFIVEDLEKIYPAAVQYVEGKPEMWNANILIPAMMKLIQDLNAKLKEVEEKYAN